VCGWWGGFDCVGGVAWRVGGAGGGLGGEVEVFVGEDFGDIVVVVTGVGGFF